MRLEEAQAALLEDGFCVVPGVIDSTQVALVRQRLLHAVEDLMRQGTPVFLPYLDPNESNVRVFNLLDIDQIFRDLILDELALELVQSLLGPKFLVSNFTANIAKPGSQSMVVHSDQGIVVPQPWVQPWSINIIWCLDDVYADNGATLYLPGSHRYQVKKDLPENPRAQMLAFEATAGSIIAMDGRMWHTSGENVTANRERALLFGYYSAAFVRPQVNWNAALSAATQAQLGERLQDLLGLGAVANQGIV